jgi:hypothetical protein
MGVPTPWVNRRRSARHGEGDLVLRFRYPGPVARTLGPFTSFRIDAAGIRTSSQGPLLAYQRHQLWQLEGKEYARLECNTPLVLRFETSSAGRVSAIFGPYRSFSCAAGIVHADHEIFAAFYEALGDWVCYADRSYWQALIVSLARD